MHFRISCFRVRVLPAMVSRDDPLLLFTTLKLCDPEVPGKIFRKLEIFE